jgi:hypothetical protein
MKILESGAAVNLKSLFVVSRVYEGEGYACTTSLTIAGDVAEVVAASPSLVMGIQ